MIFLLLSVIGLYIKSSLSLHLSCVAHNGNNYTVSPDIQINVNQFGKNFHASCPCASEAAIGKCRADLTKDKICMSSLSSYYCLFDMKEVTITGLGGIFDSRKKRVSLSHPSLYGHSSLEAGPFVGRMERDFYKALNKKQDSYDLVIPTRIHWDDCFNHLSFATLPLIGLVSEVLPSSLISHAVWHASEFGAALINLMGIPFEKIIVEKTIFATRALLPWIPYWDPIETASMRGISANVSKIIINGILTKQFPDLNNSRVLESVIIPYDHYNILEKDPDYWKLINDKNSKLVVYLGRNHSIATSRKVENDKEIIQAIKKNLLPGFHLVILGHTDAFDSVLLLQKSWHRYAQVISKASVLIAPHGGGLNNIMWTPDHCHVVEFNNYPDFKDSKIGPIRNVFMNAWWAKTPVKASGKYWVIEPSKRSKDKFYFSNMNIAIREIMQVLEYVKVVKSGSHNHYPVEEHVYIPDK